MATAGLLQALAARGRGTGREQPLPSCRAGSSQHAATLGRRPLMGRPSPPASYPSGGMENPCADERKPAHRLGRVSGQMFDGRRRACGLRPADLAIRARWSGGVKAGAAASGAAACVSMCPECSFVGPRQGLEEVEGVPKRRQLSGEREVRTDERPAHGRGLLELPC